MEFKKIEIKKLWTNYATKIGISGPIYKKFLPCPWCKQLMDYHQINATIENDGWQVGFIALPENGGRFHYTNFQPIHCKCNELKNNQEAHDQTQVVDDMTILETLISKKFFLDDILENQIEEPLSNLTTQDSPILDDFDRAVVEDWESEFAKNNIEVVTKIKADKIKKLKPVKLKKVTSKSIIKKQKKSDKSVKSKKR
ncbi:hypothetical protein [Spiroplasma sabaudiense]|uniref:hypothetical protein n=1 Tax=Spiroplasma sabaudiense TaxID=216944 RepID=UPI0004B858CA|nr:hypothetical protein [Spiroplasma sabaudiense]